jgi:hypothetical protein
MGVENEDQPHEECSFNLEATIEDFLADPTQDSLQLPHMTTGQRRHAKKLVEDHPELKCESYGFGADRQLHLFKRSGRLLSTPSVEPDTPTSSCALMVRNTFIHIEGDTADERMVQTLPRDMFRQNIAQEEHHVARAVETVTDAPLPAQVPPPPEQPAPTALSRLSPPECPAEPSKPAGAPRLTPGTQIQVEGLVRAPAFNGLCGVVQFFDEEADRYSVLLSSSTAPSGVQKAKIKGENLRLSRPPPYNPLVPETCLLGTTPLRLTGLV